METRNTEHSKGCWGLKGRRQAAVPGGDWGAIVHKITSEQRCEGDERKLCSWGRGGGGRVPGKGAASAKAPQSRRLEWLETIRKEELQNEDIVGEEEIM